MSDKPGTFQTGDKRINRAGRKKDFGDLRKLAQTILNEKIDGKKRVELILRDLITNDPKKLLEIGYGKVPDVIETSGIQRILVEYAQTGDLNGPIDSGNTPSSQQTTELPVIDSQETDCKSG